MPSTNDKLAVLFEEMAEFTELLGGNRFKVNAFAKVARQMGELTVDVATLSRGDLLNLEGIGTGTADRIVEFVETAGITDHQRMAEQVPSGVLVVMNIPGVGPKSAALFWKEAGVESVDDLKAKLDDGTIEALKGFGAKKVENIRKNLAFAESAGDRTRIGTAYTLVQRFLEVLREAPGVQRMEHAGSLRRGRETIGDLDILVAAEAEDADAIFDVFVGHEAVAETILRGDTKASVRTGKDAGGMQVDLRVVPPSSFGAALMYFTGSKEHNVKMRERALEMGFTLNEYALAKKDDKTKVVAAETEEQVFAKLGLAWVPPELREDRGELALAEKDELPELLELSDIRSELHTHTTASDGTWSIEQLALAAAQRGFHTVAVTDHSKGQVQANGLNEDRLVKHIAAIRKVAKKLEGTITLLTGSEVDILVDGRLDYPDELLAELDVVVASPHASLAQEPKKATARLLKAMENPYVTVMGHPTGRLVLRREGLSPDVNALCKAAAARGVALEINANHYRLDLRDTHARAALEHGCKLAINTDAHGPADLDQLRFGVLTARRAGATKADVVNAMTKTQLAKWLKSTRP